MNVPSFQALWDYKARCSDELSFKDGFVGFAGCDVGKLYAVGFSLCIILVLNYIMHRACHH